ncbi:MAG: STM3941 family protein [Cardiobacteriaceae bacterium]|nr:STM3941 family protein [Cardiobacteriaceae bacterium]
MKFFSGALFSIFLVYIGFWVFENGQRSDKYIPFITESLGIVTVLIGLFLGVTSVIMLFKRRAGLYLSAQGIDDATTLFSVGEISWAEIIGIRRGKVGNQRALLIDIRSPQQLIENKTNVLQRYILRGHLRKSGTPVVVGEMSISAAFDELEEALNRELLRYRQRALSSNY